MNNNIKFFNYININKNNKKYKFVSKNVLNKIIKKNLIKIKKINVLNFHIVKKNKLEINLKFYENKIIFKDFNK
jgi:hypothetical protein